MKSECRPTGCVARSPRQGLVAVSEVLVMAIVVTGLFALASQLTIAINSDATSASKSNACSDRGVYRVSIDGDGRRMWVYRPREGIVHMELATSEIEQSLPLSGREISTVAHSRDGSTTLLCGLDGTAVMFCDGHDVEFAEVGQSSEMIVDAAVSHNGSISLCITSTGKVLGWIREGSEVRNFVYNLPIGSPILRTGLNSAGTQLYVARIDGVVTFHSPETGSSAACELNVDEKWRAGGECTTFTWSDDERLFGLATSAGRVRVYELATGRVVCDGSVENAFSTTRPTTMAISPDGQRLAVATNTCTVISLWDLRSGEPTARLHGHDGIVRTLQFSPKSDMLYSGSYDGTIREWSMHSNSQLRILE
jgi:WD40 repeat protein